MVSRMLLVVTLAALVFMVVDGSRYQAFNRGFNIGDMRSGKFQKAMMESQATFLRTHQARHPKKSPNNSWWKKLVVQAQKSPEFAKELDAVTTNGCINCFADDAQKGLSLSLDCLRQSTQERMKFLMQKSTCFKGKVAGLLPG